MKKSFKELKKMYENINNMGYVKSMRKGNGGIGFTFESLIGKKEDFESNPDYKDIEIKTMRRSSLKIINLINITPDGDYPNQMERALTKLGYPERSELKSLNVSIYGNSWKYIGKYTYKKVKLEFDEKKKKMNLVGYNHEKINLKMDISWSYRNMKKKLKNKLKYVAVIMADSKIINNEEYFFYNNIELYKLKKFNNFKDLLKFGVINIELRVSHIKEGEYKGKIKSRGTNFHIKYEDLGYLFKRIY